MISITYDIDYLNIEYIDTRIRYDVHNDTHLINLIIGTSYDRSYFQELLPCHQQVMGLELLAHESAISDSSSGTSISGVQLARIKSSPKSTSCSGNN